MEFDIKFTSPTENGSWGELRLGSEIEYFEASFAHWTREQYESSWVRSLSRALQENKRTALIVDRADPKNKNWLVDWWPVYPIGDVVHFREQLVCPSKLPESATDADLFKHVPKRYFAKYRVSEWTLPRELITTWVEKKLPLLDRPSS